MFLNEVSELTGFQQITGGDAAVSVTGVFCCDMLSLAMSKGAEGAAWVTVMGGVNTLAVLRLTEMSCIILAEGVQPDEVMMTKAKEEGIAVFTTPLPVFRAALLVHELLAGKTVA